MPDLRELLSKDFEAYKSDITGYAQSLKSGRKVLGPRQRTKLREHLMDMDVSKSLPVIEQMYAAAKHQDGEQRPCAACTVLGQGKTDAR